MVSLLPDYPDEKRAFATDIDLALNELTNALREEFPETDFKIRIFKTFWSPTPIDMSAILQIRFHPDKLCDTCRYEFEKFIYRLPFKVNNKIKRSAVSFSGQYMDIGLTTYELKFNKTINDYKKEVG